MQRALLLRGCQLVAGQREMVHADVDVSGVEKSLKPCAENAKFLLAGRQMIGK